MDKHPIQGGGGGGNTLNWLLHARLISGRVVLLALRATLPLPEQSSVKTTAISPCHSSFNPLSPDMKTLILLTVLFTFVWNYRIC